MTAADMLVAYERLSQAFARLPFESLNDAAKRVVSLGVPHIYRAAARTLLRLHYVEPAEQLRRAVKKLGGAQ